jgi:hypothetical protein
LTFTYPIKDVPVSTLNSHHQNNLPQFRKYEFSQTKRLPPQSFVSSTCFSSPRPRGQTDSSSTIRDDPSPHLLTSTIRAFTTRPSALVQVEKAGNAAECGEGRHDLFVVVHCVRRVVIHFRAMSIHVVIKKAFRSQIVGRTE